MAVSAAILNHMSAAFLFLTPPLNRNRPRDKNRTKTQKNRHFRRFFCVKWSECGDSNPGPPAPKAGALPTAQHPDMKLWDCPGVSSQSKRATNCATPGYEVVRRSGRILLNCAILSHMELENSMGIQTSSAVLDWSMCWYMQDWIFISIPLSSPGKYPLAKPEDIFLQFEPYSCRRRSTTE